MNANWVVFAGAPVYLDKETVTKIIELKGPLREMKRDHIPNFIPKAVSFTLQDVLLCAPTGKEKRANWKRLPGL